MIEPVNVHNSISYVEFPSVDLAATKAFYSSVFRWEFQDWGDSYVSFSGAEVEGGFELNPENRPPSRQGALVILYSDALEETQRAVADAGGTIVREPYGFPGGRRFHFLDPSGNELAVWTSA
jgi:predicted enzyme related to lactoylglutathione lyase